MTIDIRPDEVFTAFLSEMTRKGWIKSHSWHPFRRAGLDAAFSKTNKTDEQGGIWQIEVESPVGCRSGIDLEFHVEGRPLFQNKDWLERRLKIPSATIGALSAHDLLEEWAFREAAFKALYPHNVGVVLSDFQRVNATEMVFQRDEEEFRFSLKGEWQGPWFLALAKRSS
jgi:hypothetical protein